MYAQLFFCTVQKSRHERLVRDRKSPPIYCCRANTCLRSITQPGFSILF